MASFKVAAPDEYLAITGMGVKTGEPGPVHVPYAPP
jgi:hypothetical protein